MARELEWESVRFSSQRRLLNTVYLSIFPRGPVYTVTCYSGKHLSLVFVRILGLNPSCQSLSIDLFVNAMLVYPDPKGCYTDPFEG